MAEKAKAAAVSMNDELLAMLEQPTAEIVQATPRASRGKRSNWELLTNEQIAEIFKKMKINERVAAEFKVGKKETAQFFEIGDVPTSTFTQPLSRGQKVKFTKKGQSVEDIVVGFCVTGSNQELKFKDGDKEIVFRVAGMSVVTANNGSKAIAAVALVEE